MADIKISSVEEAVFMGKVAEQAERYEDMLHFLEPLIKKSEELTGEERNLLSVPYKNISGNKRTAWRALSAIEENPKYEKYHEKTKVYKGKIGGELKKICQDAIKVIDDSMHKNSTSA